MLFGKFEKEFTVDLLENQVVEVDSYKVIFKEMNTVNTVDNTKYSTMIEVFDCKNNSIQLAPYFIISNKRFNANIDRFPSVSRIGITDIYIEPISYFVAPNPNIIRISFAIKPFIIFVWLGGILLVFGFFISLFPVQKKSLGL